MSVLKERRVVQVLEREQGFFLGFRGLEFQGLGFSGVLGFKVWGLGSKRHYLPLDDARPLRTVITSLIINFPLLHIHTGTLNPANHFAVHCPTPSETLP